LADHGFGPDLAEALEDLTGAAVLCATGNLDIAVLLDSWGRVAW